MSDLRERVPGHALIEELLRQWDLGTIRIDEQTDQVVIDEEAEGWYRGVIGERRVGTILTALGEGWTVLHSVPVGRGTSDIDHIVIGPSGAFTINTKFSPGKNVWVAGHGMYVGGTKQPYVRNALHEANRASTCLSRSCGLTVPVTALIVFVDPARITQKATPGGGEYDAPVQVLRDTEVLTALRGRPEFSTEQVARIAEAAIRPETWSLRGLSASTGTHIAREFLALEAAVGPRLSMPRLQASAGTTQQTVRAKAQRASRRTRRSRTDRVTTQLVLPIVALFGLWAWFSSR